MIATSPRESMANPIVRCHLALSSTAIEIIQVSKKSGEGLLKMLQKRDPDVWKTQGGSSGVSVRL
jgi:hypothetical protein